ncbi:hypothetical protein [Sphingomonas sp.]|uniref:hypothetical protein n=1 Tax=Sphingomonas sp. TaxID=28214 RepID=UPI00258832D6|nr:hypothetical protein [Sphingomonas sp.]
MGDAMYWQHLDLTDWIVIGAVAAAPIGAIALYRHDLRIRSRRYAAWHRAAYHEGGLIRALISRWPRGTARLTDQRASHQADE